MLAVSKAEGSLGRGTKCNDLENWSTIVKITVWQLDGGNNPAGGWWEVLLRAHTIQTVINSLMSWVIVGHPKDCWRNCRVWWITGWHVSLDKCSQWRTYERTRGLSLGDKHARPIRVLGMEEDWRPDLSWAVGVAFDLPTFSLALSLNLLSSLITKETSFSNDSGSSWVASSSFISSDKPTRSQDPFHLSHF